MHAGWSYRDPSAWCMRWGSVMFVPPLTTFTGLWKNSKTELCIHRLCVLMHADGLTRPVRPVYAVGSIMFLRQGTTLTDLWKNSEQTLYHDLEF
ncbi:hypothetical protein TNCT_101451 [Trichonephila clavata]|uniref:Uncharacterized protein n=1 Tax=Trichonephila clavata TaxID=2740835 RepID=A0A8X6G515_TRICU|nr:hypothetical protein TNCT_101451 [Trichonephila clavata]